MKGVLIAGHGSRQKSTEQTLETVVGLVREKLPETLIQTAYMEFGQPDVPAGLEKLVERGATEIAVVPYFLFDGIHIREDIPEIIDAFQKANPGLKISMGKPFGVDARLAEILLDRVKEFL